MLSVQGFFLDPILLAFMWDTLCLHASCYNEERERNKPDRKRVIILTRQRERERERAQLAGRFRHGRPIL
jgi:hypothetical protein